MATATPAKLEYARPWLYPQQREALFCPERLAVIEATTKSGKTIGAMAWLLEQALESPQPRNFWWVAPIYNQAEIAFRRFKFGLPHELVSTNESKLTLTVPGGSVIWFKGADKADSLYGEDVYAVVIDEASRVTDDAWHAVRSTVTATRGPIRIIGNVKGRRNWFYALARRAETGEPGMHYAKITAYQAVQAGILAADEVEDARRTLPDAVFRELYLAEPGDDQGNPFGLESIRACLAPLSGREPAFWGVDLAKSQDWTVAIALDRMGQVCAFERWQAPWEETIPRLEELIEGTPALVDSTGVGDPVVERLQRGRPNVEGFKFTSSSKQQLMEGLALAIQQRQVTFPDGPIRSELETFEYVYTRTGVRYEGAPGVHDDCVAALALAVAKFRQGDRVGSLASLVRSPIDVRFGGEPVATATAQAKDLAVLFG